MTNLELDVARLNDESAKHLVRIVSGIIASLKEGGLSVQNKRLALGIILTESSNALIEVLDDELDL